MIPNPRPQVESKLENESPINDYIFIGDLIVIYPPFNAGPDMTRLLCSKCHEGFCYMRNKWVGYHVMHGGWMCSQCEILIKIKNCIGKGIGEEGIGKHDYENFIGTTKHVEINSYTKKADDHYYVYECKKCKVIVTMIDEIKRLVEYFAKDFKIPVKVIEVTKQYYGSFMIDLDFGYLTSKEKREYIPILLRWLSPDKSDQVAKEFDIKLWRSYYKEYAPNKEIWLMDAACY